LRVPNPQKNSQIVGHRLGFLRLSTYPSGCPLGLNSAPSESTNFAVRRSVGTPRDPRRACTSRRPFINLRIHFASRRVPDPQNNSQTVGHMLGFLRLSTYPSGCPLGLNRDFAEFLNEGSPVHLGLLDLSTCVGLRYGHWLAG
jgi:hypothetical protein